MRAFAIDEFGATGSVRDLPEPQPAEGQVRLRVEAAALNPADLFMMRGAYKDFLEHHFPFVPGMDVSGEVEAVGPGADGFRLGDRVFGALGKAVMGEGALAEYATASAATLSKRPESVDATFGAALPLAGVAGLQTVEAAQLEPGDAVVVLGAAGGIGSFVTQLAAARGAPVVAIARKENHEYASSLGASETFDYREGDVVSTLRSAYPDGIAALIDLFGDKGEVAHFAELVRDGGRVVSMVGAADIDGLAARGVTGANVLRAEVTAQRLQRLVSLVQDGKLHRPEIRTFSLEDAGQAFDILAGRHLRGKLVVTP